MSRELLGNFELMVLLALIERYRQGRSRAWYWRQVLVAIVVGAARDIRAHKVLTLQALMTGWAVLLLVFVFFGDRTANGLARALWGWTSSVGYGSHIWWPFWLSAAFTSYLGFGSHSDYVSRTGTSA
jgi:hypothetical protein